MRTDARVLCLCLAVAGLLSLGGPARAILGTIDNVPAATLLLPYFEVDINHADGITTLFSINNAAKQAVLANVTIWSDQGAAVLTFDVYLTGYDVQTINLRDIIVNGNMPRTASVGQDPVDTISPQGSASEDTDFASCFGDLPPATLDPPTRAHVQAWLQGKMSPLTGNCAGSKHSDGIARGYVTVDTVNACNVFFPADWASYSTTITKQNVLWGDVSYINPAENFAQGETLVHIEACTTAPCFAPGDHTFYGRYDGATADDQREPLPTTLMTRYVNGGAFNGGTSFLVWREASQGSSYSCSLPGPVSWYPLPVTEVVMFDEEENFVIACPFGTTTCIPNEAQRLRANTLTAFPFGWIFLNYST